MLRHFFTVVLLLLVADAFSQEQISLYFDSNQFELTKKEENRLNQWLLANSNHKIVAIHGFTDEDGTTGFNDTLAQKRVDFIFEKVKDQIQIRADFKTLSLGEKFKQSDIKAENRRVTIFYILEQDIPREDEILGLKPMTTVVEEPKPEIEYPEKLVFENPNGTKTEYKLDRDFMKRVGNAKSGEKLKIDNLNFVINTFAIVPESRGKLYELLLVLQNNPQLKIEIQGHLCCMPVDRTDLSTQRAKAIYNFLITNEVYRARLSYKGFGSSQPIHPLPEKNEAERAANRRVEILIVEN
ncbi:OmpA family protein [Flavobacterium sp.]|jgi:outer membrane protein OmpA-like peptidoglycan-associated protein|uniref:OmpA family protein n=1 Tax=Flavobacterium sp. TaxID=239 RepID=UPI0037C19D5A